jgi:hypothetical protein
MTATRSPRSTYAHPGWCAAESPHRARPLRSFSLDAQQFALLGADGHEKGAVSLVAQLADGRVRTNVNAGFERYAQLPQDRNLLVDDVPGQAVGRDAQGQHAAQDVVFFEDRDGKSLDGQKIGAGQAGRPAAHHGHFFFRFLGVFFGGQMGWWI